MIDPRMLQSFMQKMPFLAQQNQVPGAQAFGAAPMYSPNMKALMGSEERGPMPGNGKRYGAGGIAAQRSSMQSRKPIMGRPVQKQQAAKPIPTVASALGG